MNTDPPTNFEDLWHILSGDEQTSLLDFFQRWHDYDNWSDSGFLKADAPIVIENLKKDHFLPKQYYAALIDFLLLNANVDIEETITGMRQLLWGKYLCAGGKVQGSYPDIAGTVVIKDFLEEHLLMEYPDLFDTNNIDVFLAKEPEDYDEDERFCLLKLGYKAVWLTWNENDLMGLSFDFSPEKDPKLIATALGLDEIYFKNEPFLLFLQFYTKNLADIKRPTIADANVDNDKFRPTATTFVKHGKTRPLEKLTHLNGFSPERPEGILLSNEISLEHLVQKIVDQ